MVVPPLPDEEVPSRSSDGSELYHLCKRSRHWETRFKYFMNGSCSFLMVGLSFSMVVSGLQCSCNMVDMTQHNFRRWKTAAAIVCREYLDRDAFRVGCGVLTSLSLVQMKSPTSRDNRSDSLMVIRGSLSESRQSSYSRNIKQCHSRLRCF